MIGRILVVLLGGLLGLGWGGAVQAQTYGTLPDSIPDRFETDVLDRSVSRSEPGAAVRLDAQRLVVKGPGEATLYGRKVITVFGEDGRTHGRFRQVYDAFVEIEDLEGRVLDAQGEEIKELDDEHLRDFSATQSFSLYSDTRVRMAELYADRYPYTVEYRYELEISSSLRWPTWYPQRSEIPTEFGQFEVEVPAGYRLRHSVRGDSIRESSFRTDRRRGIRWRVANRGAFEQAPYGPSWREQAPSVGVAPTSFEVAGVPGKMGTWADFGRWYHRLKKTRDQLSPGTAQRMRRVVEGATTTRDTIRRLYRHLQTETRYVSVQLGIGGWQPFPASYVEERGYGDCKALTNYLEASLDAVGISSHPVLIYRDMDPPTIIRDFPSNQFNHVVLAVPTAQDTLWLENTDTTAPFGHVAADIEDRYGLMVTPGGGELVRTPASRAADNQQRRTATVSLTPNGDGEASVHTTYTGNQQDRVRRALTDASPRERREWVRERVDIPSFDLNSADFSAVDAYRDTVGLPLTLGLPGYASKTGPRLFLPLNLMQRSETVPPESDGPRPQPVHAVPYPFVDVDSVRYELPAGYEVETMPEPVSIDTEFATYEARVTRTEDALIYYRRLEWREKTLPPNQYEAFRTFRKRVVRADKAQAVLVKEQT